MHASLLVRPGADLKNPVRLSPLDAGWQYVSFSIHRLEAGERVTDATHGEEVAVVMLAGRAKFTSATISPTSIGDRDHVFDGLPWAVYLPPKTDFQMEAVTDLTYARCGAVADWGEAPRIISPDDVDVVDRGHGSTGRRIHNILMANAPAERLLVVEVLTPGGSWSSYPPHKHDTHAPPRETYLEEVYYHRLKQPGTFAFQRVYTDDQSVDETLAVADGDTVIVPKGYHPVAAPPGCDLYYLNVMAGPERLWQFAIDPSFEHLAGHMQEQSVSKGSEPCRRPSA